MTGLTTLTTPTASVLSPKTMSLLRWRPAFMSSRRGLISACMVASTIVVGALAQWIVPYGADDQSSVAFASPSTAHLLGTDELGRDIFSRAVLGIQLDLILAVAAVPLGALVGVLMGLSGGIYGGLGQISARIFDIILGFPAIVLGIAVAMLLSPGLFSVAVAIAVFQIPIFGRLTRGGLLAELDKDYVVAARALGASRWRILRRHVLPNIQSALLVQCAIGVADAVFLEGGLSIVGLGVQAPTPSLGSIVQTGLSYVSTSPLYVVAPIVALAWMILAFSLMAEALNSRVREN